MKTRTDQTASNMVLRAGKLSFSFMPDGSLYQAMHGDIMINQLLGNPIDGGLNNLYLRLHTGQGIEVFPLLGIQSRSQTSRMDNHMLWEGEANGVQYRVIFTLSDSGIWFWNVELTGHGVHADVVYGQDVGIADPGAVRNNEAYLSQYIDHAVFESRENGYVVCSRQNQSQRGKFPYLQQGSMTKAKGYSTDGFQFFGLSYKETNKPEGLFRDNLANEVYQYEFAYTALQSELVELDGTAQIVFYGLFKEDHPEAVTSLEFQDELKAAWTERELLTGAGKETLPAVELSPTFGETLQTLPFTEEELDGLFPNRRQEEYADNKLMSFFTDSYEHVVLKEKELRVERPHGHILMSGGSVELGHPVITTTSYMYGLFNSQLVVGNTNFNKMMSNARNALNVPKTSGQRIYVETGGTYKLLTMPSLFEIGFNYVRWYYKTEDDVLIITNFTSANAPDVHLAVRSKSGKAYRFLVTHQITMNVAEYEVPYHVRQKDNVLVFQADGSSLSASVYPDLHYRMQVVGADFTVTDETRLAPQAAPGSASLTVLELGESAEWTMTIQGCLDTVEPSLSSVCDADQEISEYRDFLSSLMNGFRLSFPDEKDGGLFKVNALAWWYTHNMLVHYLVPHGLEQYGGAAWGTRDVCQGPVEYFMAVHKYEQVRDILLQVYSHQYEEDGSWPQWFMFDKYAAIQQEESHGDIIVWPLKVLGDYLSVTRDYGILEQKVPYTRKHGFDFTEEPVTILDHVLKQIKYIKDHFLHDTFLSSYGDGDWDDTLQPANAQLKQYMVSSWTVALTYQTLNQFARVMKETDTVLAEDMAALAQGIRDDFHRHILKSDVIPGFVYMEDPDDIRFLVHPTDEETGIKYRLLPMTRGMISELLTPEQAESHYQLIREKFYCPDGVRLMNRPAAYEGGVSTHFKRAETAANFGREIGLQYVHAHIRFVEAMAKLGKADEVWSGLERINPIGISEVVPNAELRQSNAYFSSSDGQFKTRYEAQERFDELRSGTVPVKGGWRIYSSGPGIYMNQLISNALGIRETEGDLIIDPVLTESLNGLQFGFEYAGMPVTFRYHLENKGEMQVLVNGRKADAEPLHNRYRPSGVRISRNWFMGICQGKEERCTIDIFN